MEALATIAPMLIMFNCIMISHLVRKVDRIEKAINPKETRDAASLERDVLIAHKLLQDGKPDDAKKVVDRILGI